MLVIQIDHALNEKVIGWKLRIAYGSTKTHAQRQVQINDDIRVGRVNRLSETALQNIACGSLFFTWPFLHVPLLGAWKVNISLKEVIKKENKTINPIN